MIGRFLYFDIGGGGGGGGGGVVFNEFEDNFVFACNCVGFFFSSLNSLNYSEYLLFGLCLSFFPRI